MKMLPRAMPSALCDSCTALCRVTTRPARLLPPLPTMPASLPPRACTYAMHAMSERDDDLRHFDAMRCHYRRHASSARDCHASCARYAQRGALLPPKMSAAAARRAAGKMREAQEVRTALKEAAVIFRCRAERVLIYDSEAAARFSSLRCRCAGVIARAKMMCKR